MKTTKQLKAAEYYRKNLKRAAEQSRENALQRLYGISLAEHRLLTIKQDGKCAICGNIGGKKGLVVDHNHDLGTIRALLCTTCNAGLGMFKDNTETLQKAVRYLLHHGN